MKIALLLLLTAVIFNSCAALHPHAEVIAPRIAAQGVGWWAMEVAPGVFKVYAIDNAASTAAIRSLCNTSTFICTPANIGVVLQIERIRK